MLTNKRLRFQLASGISVVLATICLIGLLATQLKIGSVQCSLVSGSPCPTEVVAELSNLTTHSWLLFSPESGLNWSEALRGSYQLHAFSKSFPDSLQIVLSPINPDYSITFQNNIYLVSKLGNVLPSSYVRPEQTTLLCNITFSDASTNTSAIELSSDNLPATIEPLLHQQILLTLSRLALHRIPCQSIEIVQNHAWLLSTAQSYRVIIDPQNTEINLNRLSTYLSLQADEVQSENYSFLDVRFQLPVLRNSF